MVLTVAAVSIAEQYEQRFLGTFVQIPVPFSIIAEWNSSAGGARKDPSAQVTEKVYERDGALCALCGLPGNRKADDQWALSLDHVIPCSLRGHNNEANLRVTHRYCNGQRQRIPYPETISAADLHRCRRCGEPLTTDFLIEHLVELGHPGMWDKRLAWPVHRACHRADSWPAVPEWSLDRLPHLSELLQAPLILDEPGSEPGFLITLPEPTSRSLTPLPTSLPLQVSRHGEVIMLQWVIPGRFGLQTVLSREESHALARDLLIASCRVQEDASLS
jgi:ribosomal protein L37E